MFSNLQPNSFKTTRRFNQKVYELFIAFEIKSIDDLQRFAGYKELAKLQYTSVRTVNNARGEQAIYGYSPECKFILT